MSGRSMIGRVFSVVLVHGIITATSVAEQYVVDWTPGQAPLDQSQVDTEPEPGIQPAHSGLVGWGGGAANVSDTDLAAMAHPALPAPGGGGGCTGFIWMFGTCYGGGMFDELHALGGRQAITSASKHDKCAYYPEANGEDFVTTYKTAIGWAGTRAPKVMAEDATRNDPWGPAPTAAQFPRRKNAASRNKEQPQYHRTQGPAEKLRLARVDYTKWPAEHVGHGIAIIWSGDPYRADRNQVSALIGHLLDIGFKGSQIFLFYGPGRVIPGHVLDAKYITGRPADPIDLRAAKKTVLQSLFAAMFGAGKLNPKSVFFLANDHGYNTKVAGGIRLGGGGGSSDPGLSESQSHPGHGDEEFPEDSFPGTEKDCNTTGTDDGCDIGEGTSEDCNGNDIPDECDIDEGTSDDIGGNGIPDECEEPGACSSDDGTCTEGISEEDCTAASGWFYGPGTLCPDPEVSCLPEAVFEEMCEVMDPLAAFNLGGLPLGPDGSCLGDANGNGLDDACEPPSIPAVSEWGLVVMTLLVMTAGTIMLGRVRRRAAA